MLSKQTERKTPREKCQKIGEEREGKEVEWLKIKARWLLVDFSLFLSPHLFWFEKGKLAFMLNYFVKITKNKIKLLNINLIYIFWKEIAHL